MYVSLTSLAFVNMRKRVEKGTIIQNVIIKTVILIPVKRGTLSLVHTFWPTTGVNLEVFVGLTIVMKRKYS